MVTLERKMFMIDGKPQLILAGEIHYFRLKKDKWQTAIDFLLQTGCNTVTTYIPWLCHEYTHGDIDLTGRHREEHDLKAFIEMVEANGLYFIPRPGPFQMAELKNEGLPYWLYEEFPDICPTTWDNNCSKRTVDYLNPNFLRCADDWYSAVMSMISGHLIQNGGTTIAVQLDNEVGMIDWLSNAPTLSDAAIDALIIWLSDRYGDALPARYDFNINDKTLAYARFRSPTEEMALPFHKDLGYFMRIRFKNYFTALKESARKYGVVDVPFIVNIHGSGGHRGVTYPIGISQLYQSYNYSDEFMSGSDYYIGDIDIGNFQDIYLANIFTDCVNSKNQPLASMEFEAGDSNYGDNYDARTSPSAIDKKTRMFIATGNRLLNYYLFSGGENYRLPDDKNDGNNRIAFTGERHGFAAPIGPETTENVSFPILRDVTKLIAHNAKSLASMEELTDNLVLGFIPDYYMTEYHYPNSKAEDDMIKEILSVRDRGYCSVLAKSLLLTNHAFKALNIQDKDIVTEISRDTTLVIASCLYLSSGIQRKIVAFLSNGGNAFIYGKLPIYDMEGNSCTILADFLGAKHEYIFTESEGKYPSVYPCGIGEGNPETRSAGQCVTIKNGDVFLREYGTDGVCGFTTTIGSSKIVCLTADYHSRLPLMRQLFEFAGIKRRFSNDCPFHGIFITAGENPGGERFLHIINTDGYDKTFNVFENGRQLFENAIFLKGDGCLMLPFNVKIGAESTIISATAELLQRSEAAVTCKLTQNDDVIVIKTAKTIAPSKDFSTAKENGNYVIRAHSKALESDCITIELN